MRLVPKTHIAQLWGKSRAWIYKRVGPSGEWRDCIVGDKLDVEHEIYVAYCKSQGYMHTVDNRLVPLPPERELVFDTPFDVPDGESVDQIMDLKLREILDRFGEEGAFSSWLKDLKIAEDIREKRLKNEVAEKSLISREGVQSQLMGLLEELSRRLLQDGSKTITRRTYAAANSGVALEDSERETRDMISQHLRKAKDGIKRRLRKL